MTAGAWEVRVDGAVLSTWPSEARAQLEAVRFVARELRAGRPNPAELVTVTAAGCEVPA